MKNNAVLSELDNNYYMNDDNPWMNKKRKEMNSVRIVPHENYMTFMSPINTFT